MNNESEEEMILIVDPDSTIKIGQIFFNEEFK